VRDSLCDPNFPNAAYKPGGTFNISDFLLSIPSKTNSVTVRRQDIETVFDARRKSGIRHCSLINSRPKASASSYVTCALQCVPRQLA
jgi:hypothetical protein